ncbi:MAG: helix-turn-helix domain-containing protein [Planctomycetes bacterium]|nr:helix-turn-helix domain-containing protein [Planctomycetota bacterium]
MPKKHLFITLSPSELIALEDFMRLMAFQHKYRARLRGNAIWMSSQQHKTVEQIAKSLNKSKRTIYSWFKQYMEKRIDGLKDDDSKLTPEQISRMMEISYRSKPLKHGRERKIRWSYRKIAKWVKEQWGITISHERLRQIIRKRLLNI